MREAHRVVADWMAAAGMATRVDAAGNLRGVYLPPGCYSERRVLIGSHLDTVVNAGKYDGVLGVMLGIATVAAVRESGEALPWAVEVIGFSDEEGVRFGAPFLGSRALAGTLDEALLELRDASGTSVGEALREFGVDPAGVPECAVTASEVVAYVEPHIEQGPRLEQLGAALGVVSAIAGQTRLTVEWNGAGGHAGTVPMDGRNDALAAACRWVTVVEELARNTAGLVATVGRMEVEPNATNCITRRVRTSLDVRSASDAVRLEAVLGMTDAAAEIGRQSRVGVEVRYDHEHSATPMDAALTAKLAAAIERAGGEPHTLVSGAGHDAGMMAAVAPAAMLFVRCRGGVSHDPTEFCSREDVTAALGAMAGFVEQLATRDIGA
jgi:allantoate deiminase